MGARGSLVYDHRVERRQFEELVAEAVEKLPAEFAAYLDNVVVVVEDEPREDQLRALGMNPRRQTLFGLYEGVPLALRGGTFGNALPDKITLFYGPLLRACRTPSRIREQVRRTVIHEIGHHFGLEDRGMREDGY